MKTERKKILFIHPDLRGGGAEKVLVNLLNTLDQYKYSLELLTVFNEGVNKGLLSQHIKHRYVFKKVFRGWSILQKLFSPSFLFKKLIKDDYDLIIAYLEGVPTRIVGGCANSNTKLVSWVHVDLTNFDISHIYKNAQEMKNLYLKMDAVVGVSNTALKSIEKLVTIPKNKAHVIHNVVDTELIVKKGKKVVNEIQFSKKVINICTVGRLTHQKGYLRLLNIVHELMKQGLSFHLYILGQGELENDLKGLIKEHKMHDCVTLLGFQSNPHKYVSKCDLFVCSSFQEGFSTAVTEAVVLGIPVVTTNCAGMEEILDNGTVGQIVENDEKALLEGLKMVIEDPVLLKKYKTNTLKKSIVLQERNNTKEVEKLFDYLLTK